MIEKMNAHYSMTNPASVYDEEALTALELAGRTAAKMNQTVEAFNTLEENTGNHLNEQDKEIADRLKAQDDAVKKMNDVTMPENVKTEMQRRIDNGDFDRSIDEYAGGLEARVDNLLGSMTEGSTTMDAEVIDIRVGVDGKTYENAGEAVRGQVSYLVNRLGSVDSINLFNKDNITEDYYLIEGKPTYNNTVNMNVSEFIPVTPNEVYSVSGMFNGFVYDANQTMILATTNCFVVPSNGVYFRFTVADSNLDKAFLVKSYYLPEYTTYGDKIDADRISKTPNDMNVFNEAHLERGKYLNIDGTTSGNSSYSTTLYIYGAEDEIFTVKNVFTASIYNSDYSFSRMIPAETFQMTNDERYIRVTFKNEDFYRAVIQKKIGYTEEKDGYTHTTVCVGADKLFKNITSALNAITDNNTTNRYTVLVDKGVYNETFYTKDYVDIIGANRWNTIVNFTNNNPTDESILKESTIWAMSTTLLKNLTITTTGTKYAVHSDGESWKAYRLRIEDCILQHNGIVRNGEVGAGTAIGIGLYQNQHIELVRCYLNGVPKNVSFGASCLYCHNIADTTESKSGHRSLTVKNCVMNEATYGIRLQAIENNDYQDNDAFFINNVNNGVTPEFFEHTTKDSWHVTKFE